MKFRVFNNNNNEFRHDCLYINRNGINTKVFDYLEQEKCNYTDLIEIRIEETDKIISGFLYYLIEYKKDIINQYRNGTTVSHITIPNLKKALREIMSANEILRL